MAVEAFLPLACRDELSSLGRRATGDMLEVLLVRYSRWSGLCLFFSSESESERDDGNVFIRPSRADHREDPLLIPLLRLLLSALDFLLTWTLLLTPWNRSACCGHCYSFF